jgi:phage tail protein X
MSKTYTTVQGDHWDAIAYRELGSTDYTAQLMWANQEHIGTFVFPAGVVLTLPEIKKTQTNQSVPPWKR